MWLGAWSHPPRRSIGSGRGWVDGLADFSDRGGRKPADLGVLADRVLILGQVHAEGLVVRDVALDPLDVRGKLVEHFIRLHRCLAQLLALKAADLRDVSLDDEPTKC